MVASRHRKAAFAMIPLTLLLLLSAQWPVVASARNVAASASGGSLYLKPSRAFQRETFRVPAHPQECQVMARTYPGSPGTRCYLVISVEYQGEGVQPILSGRPVMKGRSVKTAYASVTACLSAATLAGRGDCYRAVQLCTIKGTTTVDGRPICYEAWDARVSTEFEYDGQKAQRIWLDPSLLTGYGFVVHPSHAFDLPRRSGKSGTLAIGDTVRITESIPETRPVNVIHVLRMTVYPKGNVRFSVS